MSNYWVIPDISTLKTPLSMLKEQASALSDATKGVLRGEVTTGAFEKDIILMLSIVAPSLGSYKYNVLSYRQPITLFPGQIWLPAKTAWSQVNNAEDLDRQLKEVLASESVSMAVAGLLAQSMETSN